MILNRHWPRWIKASFNVHFNAFAVTGNLPMYIEGTTRDTNDAIAFAELRLTGPRITEQSKGYWCIEIDVDILIDQKEVKNDIYAYDRNIGAMLAGFTTDIAVFKLGSGLDDAPDEQLGCFSLLPSAPESIIITNFGAPNKDVKMLQATIEATYRMNLS